MHPFAEVHLGDRRRAPSVRDVDQERDLDRVSVRERELVKGRPSDGRLARQRLPDEGQMRTERSQERPREQLGDATALLGHAVQGPPVGALHDGDRVPAS